MQITESEFENSYYHPSLLPKVMGEGLEILLNNGFVTVYVGWSGVNTLLEEKKIQCPDCEDGIIALVPGRNGYPDYLGCLDTRKCNYRIGLFKVLKWERKHNCPYCICYTPLKLDEIR